jgi:hypothetical protein
MFITNEIEFEAAVNELDKYLLIEKPTDEQKRQYSELAVHMDKFIMTRPTEQETMH